MHKQSQNWSGVQYPLKPQFLFYITFAQSLTFCGKGNQKLSKLAQKVSLQQEKKMIYFKNGTHKNNSVYFAICVGLL